ncbi:hypothetical protein KJ660_00145, partial [Candidatus Micrarchaeota archaeon]|nr:hypothetical protein [Candidatus Micrarchaeota archaeon]
DMLHLSLIHSKLQKYYDDIIESTVLPLQEGIGARVWQKLLKGFKVERVDEINAIGEGARFLSKKKNFLTVNIGTGTPFVFVKGKKIIHLGGTGLGGGSLEGLGKILLNKRVEELEEVGRKGKLELDLKVKDIIGKGIGIIPADATASNFGKAMKIKVKREEIALCLLNLMAEGIGVMSVFAARSSGCSEIVFTGRVTAKNKFIRERIKKVMKLFNNKGVFPSNAEYATAIGAIVSNMKNLS